MDQTAFALDAAVRLLDFYEEYFDIPYPLPKQGQWRFGLGVLGGCCSACRFGVNERLGVRLICLSPRRSCCYP